MGFKKFLARWASDRMEGYDVAGNEFNVLGLGSCTPLALLDHASHKDLTNKTNCIATTKRMSLLFVTIKGG